MNPSVSVLSSISSLLLFTGAAFAQPRIPAPVEEAIGIARSLPPEFASDLLIRAAALPELARHPRRKELLDDAFVLAAHAQHAFPRRSLPAVDPNSADYVLSRASQLGFDTLSLQSRVIQALADPQHIERLPIPPSTPFTCDDTLLWDTTPYWRLIAKQRLRPPRSILSLVEVTPAIDMIRSLDPSREQLESLTAWLLDGLRRLPQDDRAFTAAIARLPGSIEQLAILRAQNGLHSRELLSVLSSTLIRHLSGARCKDALEMTRSTEAGAIWDFNHRMRFAPHLLQEELPEIRHEDTQPNAHLGRNPISEPGPWRDLYFQLAKSQNPEEILGAKLYDWQPTVWMLLARPFIGSTARHPVIAAYSKLELLLPRRPSSNPVPR